MSFACVQPLANTTISQGFTADDSALSLDRSRRSAQVTRISAELRHVAAPDRASLVGGRDVNASRPEQLHPQLVRIELHGRSDPRASRARSRLGTDRVRA